MKKLVLVAAVAFSASLFSCGSSEKAAEAQDTVAAVEEVVEVAEVAVDTVPADTVPADTTVVAE